MNRFRTAIYALCLGAGICFAPPALAQLPPGDSGLPAGESLPGALVDVGIDEHLDASLPMDAAFRDDSGKDVTLADYFHGNRPVLFNFAYYRCPMLCTLVLSGMVDGMKQSPLAPGEDFEVMTLSIDPRETPELAAAKKSTHVEALGKPGAVAGWHFLTGKEKQIARVADALGFRYHYNRATDDYSHAAAIFAISPDGKICRYLYGVVFRPNDLRLALAEAKEGKSLSLGDKLLLFCYHYDANAKGYALFAQNSMRIGGYIVAGLLALLLGGLWIRESRNHRQGK
jgi:protein SCO1/2